MDKALTWYQKSIPLWEDVVVFWKGMETNYTNLKMAQYGITKETYQELLQALQ